MSRVEPRFWGVKVGYNRKVNHDFRSLQLPVISFQNERLLYLTQQFFAADMQ